jgi:hypothetical protein
MSEKLLRLASVYDDLVLQKSAATDFTKIDPTTLVNYYWGFDKNMKEYPNDPKYSAWEADKNAIKAELDRRELASKTSKTPGYADAGAFTVPQLKQELNTLNSYIENNQQNMTSWLLRRKELQQTLALRGETSGQRQA